MEHTTAHHVLLSLETSGSSCSVALHQNGRLIAYAELHQEKSHSGRLTLLIEELLRHSNLSPQNLTAVAVSAGPGSYTGLRIGVSTAKGLCFALGIPLLAVDTLQAMSYGVAAQGIVPPEVLLCPCIEARRMEIYRAIWDAAHHCLLPAEPHILTPHSFDDFSTRPLWLFGSGAEKTFATIQHPNKYWLPHVQPSARFIGELALRAPQVVDIAYFEPQYIKPFYTPAQQAP
ncbi:MAG: tRNA (adenosine(37)-N6)-threonylcarbamoyltransferase complex dimerization subunit type 1 TsaB [Cytophagales bacterium]|nr:tRNA (adenosine(37)-N6)-threonylcarbamoyltransferase complex dimerization subunit type 1 TsaB [Bernardetiaceae bacterium]MDW8204397.1 tRNA (adenosine(37)-N6)-threonylcarbamoyltransferase complex dimerization subunit type 1 TsaB [Cytophagales bacterium]